MAHTSNTRSSSDIVIGLGIGETKGVGKTMSVGKEMRAVAGRSTLLILGASLALGCGADSTEQPVPGPTTDVTTGLAPSSGVTTQPNPTTSGSSSSVSPTSSSSPTTSASSGPVTTSDETGQQSSTAPTTSDSSSTSTANPTQEPTSTEGETSGETPVDPGPSSGGSAGCGAATAPASGRFDIMVDGETREYILAVPEGYDSSKPYRLVFGWHPWGGSAQQVAGMGAGGYYGLQGEADGEAIFVAPEGLDFGGNGKGWGNEGGKDLAFFDAMLERFSNELCIDTGRVFSTGFSFGGMMSWALGCGRGDKVRAIAPMAGNTTVSGCLDGDNPVAVMGFHGDDDTVVSIEGGRVGRDEFVARNNCGAEMPSESTYCDGAGQDRQPCSCVTYEGCDEGYPVTWCEFNGPHTPAPNSAAVIWNFFAQF